jgi:cysteinyl-tRNA synthetase
MAIYIYNSLTRKKEEFIPLNPKEVKIYVCGPTVYDEPHIGHARSAYVFDVIRRYLAYRDYKVRLVRNVTDVDDKIIDKARKEYKDEDLNSAVRKVADKYLDAYRHAMIELGILGPDDEPKATEYVGKDNPAMQKFIALLIERQAAYVSGGDVYFDIKKAKEYGKLSRQSLDKMEAGSRIAPGENKRDPFDFALWKAAKDDEPSWDSPWGKGRPGWHIECSVMSSAILGDEFDIHGGGLDLIFPHHENEIAQSEGAGKKFAKLWMHHGLLTINGQKMAKSLGNFVTVKDFLAKNSYADLLKLFFLSAHYSNPLDYNEEKIHEIRQSLERILILLGKIDENILLDKSQADSRRIKEIKEIKDSFIKAMDDDFNTPEALASLFELVTLTNKNIRDPGFAHQARSLLYELKDIFGLDFKQRAGAGNLEAGIMILVDKRNQAKKKKDFKEADKIRKELEAQGIILEDTKDGETTWRRKL